MFRMVFIQFLIFLGKPHKAYVYLQDGRKTSYSFKKTGSEMRNAPLNLNTMNLKKKLMSIESSTKRVSMQIQKPLFVHEILKKILASLSFIIFLREKLKRGRPMTIVNFLVFFFYLAR